MKIPVDILNDLGTRFLIHLPPEEKKDPTRLCFQMELAYWFYLDFYAGEGTNLPSISIKQFAQEMFANTPGLKSYAKRTDEIIDTWKQFKISVPTYGCIMIDETAECVLLVQGYAGKGTWGFPKGKVNEKEKPHVCAAREVIEETGYDCSSKINKDLYMERKVGDHYQRLFLVPGISRDTLFFPQTRKEIRSIRWFAIKDLPMHKNHSGNVEKLGFSPKDFFLVGPFVRSLKKWTDDYRRFLTKVPISSPSVTSAFQPVDPTSILQHTFAALKATMSPSISLDRFSSNSPTVSETIPGLLYGNSVVTRDFTKSSKTPMTAESSVLTTNVQTVLRQNASTEITSQTITAVGAVVGRKKNKVKPAKARKSLDSLFDKLDVTDESETVVVVAAATTASRTSEDFFPTSPCIRKNRTFDVPAWTGFKLNYKEYVDLVH